MNEELRPSPISAGSFRTFDNSLAELLTSLPTPWFDHIDTSLPITSFPPEHDFEKHFKQVDMRVRFGGTYNRASVKVLTDASTMFSTPVRSQLTAARLTEHCTSHNLLALEFDYTQSGLCAQQAVTRTYVVDFYAYVMRPADEKRTVEHLYDYLRDRVTRLTDRVRDTSYSSGVYAPLCGAVMICYSSTFRFSYAGEVSVIIASDGIGCSLAD